MRRASHRGDATAVAFFHRYQVSGFAEKADSTLKPQIDQELMVLRKSAADYCLASAKAAEQQGDTKEVVEGAPF